MTEILLAMFSRFKGLAMVDGKPNVEVVYSIIGGTPQLKLGLRYKKQNLYKVINMFYREDKIKSTWIKFQHLCMYAIFVSYQSDMLAKFNTFLQNLNAFTSLIFRLVTTCLLKLTELASFQYVECFEC